MNLFTHLCMAHVIRREIRRHGGARINYPGFLFGNMLPDLSEFYLNIPHYHWTSFPFIIEKSESLTQMAHKDLPYTSFNYAKNLGVISHYISDYFCFAHSVRFKGNLFKHYIYELKLAYQVGKGLKAFFSRFTGNLPIFNPEETQSFVQGLYDKHEKEEQSFAGDIAYALYAASKVASSLLARTVYLQEAEILNFYEDAPEQSLVDMS